MKSCVLAVSLIVLAGPALAAETVPPETCPASGVVQVAGRPIQLTPLNQLPPGALTLTVLRTINGCGVTEVKANGIIYYVPEDGKRATVQSADGVPRQR